MLETAHLAAFMIKPLPTDECPGTRSYTAVYSVSAVKGRTGGTISGVNAQIEAGKSGLKPE